MLQWHAKIIGNLVFYCQMAVYYCIFSFSFSFQIRINKINSNTDSHKQIKTKLMFRIIKFTSVETLNFITWNEKMTWQSNIFENACVQLEQWHSPHCSCGFYISSDVRFFKIGFGCLCFMFLENMAIISRKFKSIGDTINKQWSLSNF